MERILGTVFIGTENIAHIIDDLKSAFEKSGYRVITGGYFNKDSNPDHFEFESKLYQTVPQKLKSAVRQYGMQKIQKSILDTVLDQCDTFIFLWNSILPNSRDLEKLKKRSKKVIVCWVGDDVRWPFAAFQEFSKYDMHYPDYYKYLQKTFLALNNKLEQIRNGEKYADMIFSRLDQAQLQLRPYYRWHMMVDMSKYEYTHIQKKKPLIVHAPSNRKVKGTEYVLETISLLKQNNFDFEFKLVENLKFEDALDIYKASDIVIDQLFIPGSGKLATECLAYGKIVLSRMNYANYPQNVGMNYPIVDVSPDTLYEILVNLITNVESRLKISRESRQFVETTLDVRHFVDKIEQFFTKSELQHEYVPTFFKDEFIPENYITAQIYNYWTKTVSNEAWYKQYVSTKIRNGLKF